MLKRPSHDSTSESRSSSPRRRRQTTGKSRSRASNVAQDLRDDVVQKKTRKERLKTDGRMKQAPLLDHTIVDVVHRAMARPTRRRASRYWLEQFAMYEDAKQPGTIKSERFTRCLNKMGIELETRANYEALANCFKSSDRGDSARESTASDNNMTDRKVQTVDYAAFVDFAYNVRDSDELSEIAALLRESISNYDGKKQSSTSYSVAVMLEKIDRHERGWITSTQFERVLQREDQGLSFNLSATQISTLVNRFEYEYEQQQLRIDYMQFAQWLQPLLHLDVKKVHERVRSLVKQARTKAGWKLDAVVKAMDHDRDGQINAAELKEALFKMGLPLTDAQIRCLTDEYDIDGDGKIQYREFLSSFAVQQGEEKKEKRVSSSSIGQNQSDAESTRDHIKKRKSTLKHNVRNSYSWDITKAFARKQSAKGGKRLSTIDKRLAKRDTSSSPEEYNNEGTSRQRTKRHETSSEEDVIAKRMTKWKPSKQKRQTNLTDEDEQLSSSASDNQGRQHAKARARARRDVTKKRGEALSSTESDKGTSHEHSMKRESRRRRRVNENSTKARGDGEGKDQDSSSSKSVKRVSKDRSRVKSRQKHFRESRKQRLASSSPARSRSRQKLLQRRSPRRHRSRSAYGRRTSSPRRPPRVGRSRSRQMRQSKLRNTMFNSNDVTSSFSDNNASSSGLDVEQLCRRQKARVQRDNWKEDHDDETEDETNEDKGDGNSSSDEEDDGEVWSRSDEEHYKHLKRSLRRAFDFFDLDQTSTIDKRELSHVLRALGHEFTSKELDAEMANADLDRNGQLDFNEFVAFVKKQLAQTTYLLSQQREMEIRQSFQSLDTDKNGALDEQEFEYLIYKVLQVELSIEEQDALLDFVDKDADGLISEDEFIGFMKKLQALHLKQSGKGNWRKQKQFFDTLDATSQLAYSAMKKLIRGVPMDIDRSLLMFFGIPSNFRPAISSAATCRTLYGNTMEHVLSFPSPQTIEALALDTRLNDKQNSSWFTLNRLDRNSEEYRMLESAEGVEAQAIVSLKRAAGVPKPFDTREHDVVKRCVHVCLFQEQEEVSRSESSSRRRQVSKAATATNKAKVAGAGTVVGNVHEIPVSWHHGEEDVWEFSKKSTQEENYKFLVRTNAVNDRLYLLVEFIVHLKLNPGEHQATKRSTRRKAIKERDDSGDDDGSIRELVCCWCKIPVRQLLAKRLNVLRRKEKLWGGTANAPVDIEQDELLRRRTGWWAFTNMFTKPSPPLMGIKSVPIDALPEDLQLYVRKMPPLVIAPFVSLPILAEYMVLVRQTLACVASSSSVMTCEPALKLLPKIVDDHMALSIFRKAFDAEVTGMKHGEERQLKFQQLVLRMWPSFVHWQERLPSTLFPSSRAIQSSETPANVPPQGVTNAMTNSEDPQEMRRNLLQATASGKLRLQDIRVASTPFHVREVAFRRLL